MAIKYDQKNKIRDKFKKEIEEKDALILKQTEKIEKLEKEIKDLRKKLYDAGEGKGEQHRLSKIISAQEREKKTLQNTIRELDGSKLISTFSPERQELIRRIKNLKFNNAMFNALALRFNDGLDNVIEVAALIKKNSADDLDFYTYVFRDNIVGLLEKMLKAVLNGKLEDSASKYLTNLANGNYSFPKGYTDRMPNLKNKTILTNILALINLQTVGYHGTRRKYKKVVVDKDTNEKTKTDKFLNLDTDSQLTAIFTLIEFMYDVFTNKDNEVNLMAIANSWFVTI